MVESKFVVLQMIPHTLFIEWDLGHCLLAVLLLMALFTSRYEILFTYTVLFMYMTLFTYTVLFMYTIMFTYTVLFIRPVFFFLKMFIFRFI